MTGLDPEPRGSGRRDRPLTVEYGGVFGWCVVSSDPHHVLGATPFTTDRERALGQLQRMSEQGRTCWLAEVRKVKSHPDEPMDNGGSVPLSEEVA